MASFTERLEALKKSKVKKPTAQQQKEQAAKLYPNAKIDPVLQMRLEERGLKQAVADLEGASGEAAKQELASRPSRFLPNFAKEAILEPVFRDMASTGLQLQKEFDTHFRKKEQVTTQLLPETKLEKFLFGEEPIKPVGDVTSEWAEGISNFLVTKRPRIKGLTPEQEKGEYAKSDIVADIAGLTLAPLLMGGKFAIDLALIGGPAAKSGEEAFKLASPKVVEKLVGRFGDDVAKIASRYGDEAAEALLKGTDDEMRAFLKTKALERSKAIQEASTRLLDTPEARLAMLERGVSPRTARQALDEIAELEARLLDEQAEIARLERITSKVGEEEAQATKKAISEVLTKARDISAPRQVARLERVLETSEVTARNLLTRLGQTIPDLPATISRGLQEEISPLLANLDEVRFSEIEDSFNAAKEALADYISIREPGITEEVTDASMGTANEILSKFDALASRVAKAQETLVGGDVLQQEFKRAQPQIRQILSRQSRGEGARASRDLNNARRRIAQMEGRLEELHRSPVTAALRAGVIAGLTPQQVITTRGVFLTPHVMAEFATGLKGKDLGKLATTPVLGAIDVIRAAERVQGGVMGPLQKYLIQPALERAAQANALLGKEVKTFESFLENANLIPPAYFGKAGVFFKRPQGPAREYYRRSARLFRYAEGRATKGELALITPQEKQLVSYVKAKYDQLLNTINAQRKQLNIPEIPRRQDYVSHIQRLTLLQDMGRSLVREEKMSELIPEAVKKRSKISAFFEKERLDGDFDEDIVEAFMAYLPGSTKMVAFERFAAETDALTELLPKNAKQFFKTWVKEGVLGAQPEFDQIVNRLLPIRLSNLASRYAQATGKGTILGNISTLVLQPSTALTIIPEVGMKDWLLGGMKTLTKEGLEFAKANSKVLQIRDFEGMSLGLINKVEKGLNAFNQSADKTMVVWSWLSGYRKATNRLGMNHAEAVYYADNIAAKTQVIYNQLFSPRIFRSKSGGALAQFQRFGYNMWNRLRRDPFVAAKEEGGAKALAKTGTLLGAMWATNVAYQSIGLPSPYSFLSKEGEAIEVLPIAGPAASFGPPSVLRLPAAIATLALSDDEYKKRKAKNELKKIAFTFLPGGNQLRKSVDGLVAISDGYYQVGKTKIPIEGKAEQARALLFGPSQTKASREAFQIMEQKREIQQQRAKLKE